MVADGAADHRPLCRMRIGDRSPSRCGTATSKFLTSRRSVLVRPVIVPRPEHPVRGGAHTGPVRRSARIGGAPICRLARAASVSGSELAPSCRVLRWGRHCLFRFSATVRLDPTDISVRVRTERRGWTRTPEWPEDRPKMVQPGHYSGRRIPPRRRSSSGKVRKVGGLEWLTGEFVRDLGRRRCDSRGRRHRFLNCQQQRPTQGDL